MFVIHHQFCNFLSMSQSLLTWKRPQTRPSCTITIFSHRYNTMFVQLQIIYIVFLMQNPIMFTMSFFQFLHHKNFSHIYTDGIAQALGCIFTFERLPVLNLAETDGSVKSISVRRWFCLSTNFLQVRSVLYLCLRLFLCLFVLFVSYVCVIFTLPFFGNFFFVQYGRQNT